MYPKAIEFYYAPKDVGEVLALLRQHGDQAKLLAGGQSLLPLMKLRLVEPRAVIDLNRVTGLNEVREEGGVLHIGALVRHVEIAHHPLIQRSYSILADAARNIGDWQVRNRGTLAGSLVHADPAADYPPAVIALNGIVIIMKSDGSQRAVNAADFFVGPLTTALAEDELVVRIEIPTPPPHSGGVYMKHSQVAGDFAIISVAAQITLNTAGQCQQTAIVVGGVMPKPVRAARAMEALKGKTLDDVASARAGELAAEEVETQTDMRASAEYRSQLIRVTVPALLRQAAAHAGKA